MGPRRDFLPLLDEHPLATVLAALPLEDVARACCVSSAWQRALGGAEMRFLWANLVFAPPQFLRPVTPATVRGACAKAGEELASVTVNTISLAALLPALAAAHLRLTRVTLGGGHSLPDAVLAALLSLPRPLAELRTCVRLNPLAPDASLALMRHPSLRATGLVVCFPDGWPSGGLVQGAALRCIADVVTAHAGGLRTFVCWLPYKEHRPPLADMLVEPLLDALCACTALEEACLPVHDLSVAAFSKIAAALGESPTPLREVVRNSAEFPTRHYPALLRHLLPRLSRLVVESHTVTAAVAAALQHNTTLHELHLSVNSPAARPALYAALRATRMRCVHFDLCMFEHLANDTVDLLAACDSLPRTVERVELTDCSAHLGWGNAAHAAFFRALRRLPALSSFSLDHWNRGVEADLLEALAAALLTPAPDGPPPRLSKLAVQSSRHAILGWRGLAAAVRDNASLRELTLRGGLGDEGMLAIADMLTHNRSLQQLRLLCLVDSTAGHACSGAAMHALADALRGNGSLRSFELHLRTARADAVQLTDVAAAVTALRDMNHVTCRIDIFHDWS